MSISTDFYIYFVKYLCYTVYTIKTHSAKDIHKVKKHIKKSALPNKNSQEQIQSDNAKLHSPTKTQVQAQEQAQVHTQKQKIKYTIKEGAGIRPELVKSSRTLRRKRRLYSPAEADRIKREHGMIGAAPPKLQQRHTVSHDTVKSRGYKYKKIKKSVAGTVFSEFIEHLKHLDYITVTIVAALSCIGILAVHSATAARGNTRFDIMQIGMTVIGFCIMFALSYLDYDGLTKHYRIILIINVIMLLVTAIFGTGADGSGETNRNWIRFGSFGIQPAEIAKILYIITFSAHLDAVRHRINHIKTLVGLMLHSGLIIGLVLLEKDLGQATVFIAITVVMLFAARLSLWYFAGAGAAALAAAPIIFSNLKTYQQERILVGFNPELDPLVRGYQVIQSKTAIASGGITGLGYMQGFLTQSNTPNLLPAKQTDMIFAVIGEEAGLIGTVIVLILFLGLVARLFANSMSADKMSGSLICAGVGGMIMYQAIENIGMCLGLLPVIGITLPFVSYGGSSVLGMYLAIGAAVSVYAKNDRFYFSKGKI